MTGSYERLLELAGLQRELIGAGSWPEAIAVGLEWQALVDALPSRTPSAALPLLEGAAAIVRSSAAALAAALAETAVELEHVDRGRRALASYASRDPAVALDARC